MPTRGVGRVGLSLLRGLGTLGSVLGGIVSGLDPQGTAQRMCSARSLPDSLDFEGSLAAIAGAPGLGAVASLLLLGASSYETVGGVNDLAGTSGLELGAAMRSWAFSGNF